PGGWFPEQKISVAEAIRAYTVTAAYAAFEENDRGFLEPGRLADFVVLSRDILEHSQQDHIAQTQVLLTVAGGKIVYEATAPRRKRKFLGVPQARLAASAFVLTPYNNRISFSEEGPAGALVCFARVVLRRPTRAEEYKSWLPGVIRKAWPRRWCMPAVTHARK